MNDEVEIPLVGGQVGGAVRVGDTVRRPTGPWTPAVHELLDFLQRSGVPLVPGVHGFDARGREVLDYLPGRVLDVDTETLSDRQLRSASRWLRSFHDAVAGFPRESRRWRFTERALADGEIVCHHDFAVYNLAFDGEELSGVFDWDVAGPGVRLDDLAIFAWNGPLVGARGERPAEAHLAERAAHGLRVIARAYGGIDPRAILDHVSTRMGAAVTRIAAAQRAGDPGMLRLGLAGEPAATRRRLDSLDTHLPAITAALDAPAPTAPRRDHAGR